MKVLLVHNFYKQPGGEDAVHHSERMLLEEAGHDVFTYYRHNNDINAHGVRDRFSLAKRTIWNEETISDLAQIINSFHPEIAHFTNIFPLISPSAYYALQRHQIPVVQTVQNYRLVCPSAVLMREGTVCEKCVGKKIAWPSILHACYRKSRSQSAVVATMIALHRWAKTWETHVSKYVAATEFSKGKLVLGGIPAHKIAVKPNFLFHDPGVDGIDKGYALFVGRIAQEKGVWTLINAWSELYGIPLKIVGDGPLLPEIMAFINERGLGNINCLGRVNNQKVRQLMQNASFLIFPSEWYEGFPVTIVEAFATGLPVIATRLGSMTEVVEDQKTGLHFSPSDVSDLREKVKQLWLNKSLRSKMSQKARSEFEHKYSSARNLYLLTRIYESVIE